MAIERKDVEAPAIDQWYYEIPPRGKTQSLIRLVDFHGFRLGIIFCNTQRMVDELADALLAQGFSADRLHGGITQAQRTRVMNKFKNSEFEFLVATDVAARGIDIDGITHVVNYQCPEDEKTYVHRIGRTARAGAHGIAVTFVDWDDMARWKMIDQSLNLGLPEPLETYSSSDHFFEAMKIPSGVTGSLGTRPKAATAPRADREMRKPEKRETESKKSEPSSRVRTRTKKFK